MRNTPHLIFLLLIVAIPSWEDYAADRGRPSRWKGPVLLLVIGIPLAVAIWAVTNYLKSKLITP